jgi:hypothetical protein
MEKVILHAVDDDGRDLGAAWSVEVGHGMAAVLPAERGKLVADDVYWRHVRHSGSDGMSQRRNPRIEYGHCRGFIAASRSRFYDRHASFTIQCLTPAPT